MAHIDNALSPGWIIPSSALEMPQTQSYGSEFWSAGQEAKQRRKPRLYRSRHCCDVISCSATFARPYDLVRHKQTVHGSKMQCQHVQCNYATARRDKMKEHYRKKHLPQNVLLEAKQTLQAPTGLVNDKDLRCSWYAIGPDANVSWTDQVDLEAWAWVDWNPPLHDDSASNWISG